MATITFNGDIGTPSKGFNLKIDVTYEQSIANNKTTITSAKGYVKRNNSTYYPYNTTSSAVFTVKNTDGSQLYSTTKNPKYDLGSSGYKEVLNISPNKEISHADDGKKSIVITFSFDGKLSSYYPNGSISKTVELPTIARKSSVTCADGNIGSATTINISRASSSFTHTLTYSFQGLTGTIATKTSDTSIGWTIPTSFYTKIPNANSGKGTITCNTYSGDTLIGTSTCTFNAFVINSNPTISGTVEDTNTNSITATGDKNKLVRYISNAKVVITATAKNSATISSVKVVNGSQTKTTATSTINSVDSGTFNLSCVDSRGLSASTTITKTLVNYIKPVITGVILTRPSTTSNTINASVQGLCFNGSFGVKTNSFELKWRYKKSTETTWSSYTVVTATRTGNNFTFSGELGINFSYTEAFNFEFVLSDYFMSNTICVTVTRGLPIIDIGKDDVNVNGDILCRGEKIPLVYKYTADLSSLDQNTYYPVVGYSLPKKGMSHLKLAVELNSGTKPSWSTHNSGFSCHLDILNEANGWGSSYGKGIILENSFRFTDTMPVSYQQLGNSSRPVFWCRGGGKYFIWTDYDETWTVYTSSVTFSGQTIAPTTTYPSVSLPSYCDIVVGTIASKGSITSDVSITSAGNLVTKNGVVSITRNGNTTTIGSQNTAYCHIYNSANIPFYFNKVIYANNGHRLIGYKELYGNNAGSNGTITLSNTASNFNMLEIFYRNNDNWYSSVRVWAPSGKSICLSVNYTDGANYFYTKGKEITINGTTLTSTSKAGESRIGNGVATTYSGNNNIYIYQVLGWY